MTIDAQNFERRKTMLNERIKELENDTVGNQILQFIPNNLGINLCSVKDIKIERQKDGQLVSISIVFIPSDES